MTVGAGAQFAQPTLRFGAIPKLLLALFVALTGLLGTLQMGVPSAGAQTVPDLEPTAWADVLVDGQVNYPANSGHLENVLGPPGDSSQVVCHDETEPLDQDFDVSLGPGGWVTIQFTDNALSGSGDNEPDIFIYETGGQVEEFQVFISQDGDTWIDIGQVAGQPTAIDIDQFGYGPTDLFYYVRGEDRSTYEDADFCLGRAGVDIAGIAALSNAIPGIEIVKTSNVTPDTVLNAGDEIEYTFTVTNTGSFPLTNVTVSDPLPGLSPIAPPVEGGVDLALGESTIFTATYPVTQADIDTGVIENTATATGTSPAGFENPTAEDTHIINTQTPELTLIKNASPLGPVREGNTITYTFEVMNTGNVIITGVEIEDVLDDDLNWVTGPVLGDLAPGATAYGVATYEVTEADVDAGSVTNIATATGYAPENCEGDCDPTSPPAQKIVPTSDDAAIVLNKETDVDFDQALLEGDVVTYTFIVKNTGIVPLTDVTVSDMLPGLSPITPVPPTTEPITLQPEEVALFTATYVVTEQDVQRGVIFNTATATGTPPDGPAVSAEDSEMVPPVAPKPGLNIDKVPNVTDGVGEGDTITFSFHVTNTGNIDMVDVTIVDSMGDALTWVSPISQDIARGQTVTFQATYMVTADDVVNRSITNTAYAQGDCRDEQCEDFSSPPDEEIVTTEVADPSLSIEKTSNIGADETVLEDDEILYTFTVTNTGNITLTDVEVNDIFPGLSNITPASVASLAPDGEAVFTATYTVTNDDVLAGSIENEATATGNYGDDEEVESEPDEVIITTEGEPGLEIVKTNDIGDDETVGVGDTVKYTFVVTNTGNVPLTNVTVSDPLPGLGPISPDPVTLAPGASETFTAEYTVQQSDVDRGFIENSATGTGDYGEEDITSPPDDSTVTTDPPAPAISIVKTADPDTNASPDAPVTYSFEVTNTGNVTLTNVTIDDPLEGLNWTNGPRFAYIAPGDSVTGTATYTVTEANLLAGEVENTATVTGIPPAHYSGDDPTDTDTEEITTVAPAPAISIEKSAEPAADVAAGETITYTFTVRNTGNVTLSNVTVTDPMPNLSAIVPVDAEAPITLAPGEPQTFTATYVVTEADMLNGSVENIASVTGNPPGDLTPPSDEDTEEVTTVPPAPDISIEKSASPTGEVTAGQTITYSFLVTNTGNVTLEGVTITDAMEGLNWTNGPEMGTLVPGASVTGTATYTVSEADMLNGSVDNIASVTGNPPGDLTPPSDEDTEEVTTVPPAPGISIEKSASPTGEVTAGQTITYSFVVTNTGNVTLEGVTISDAMEGLNWTNGPEMSTLVPGASVTGTATYTVTEADMLNGSVDNIASVTGNPPGELTPPEDEDTETVTTVNPAPGISIDKSADPAGNVAPGQTVTYSFVVTNTGNVTLTDVTIADGMEGLEWVNGPGMGTLAPGASVTGTATYTVIEADLYSDALVNTASVTGNPPGELTPPEDEDTETVTTVNPAPAIALVKSADPASGVALGDTITYSFTVTNTGNVALSDVTIVDGMEALTWVNGPVFESLAPGETVVGSATYVVTQADVNAGGVTNIATATGTPPGEETPPSSPPSEVHVPIESASAISMVKSVSPDTTIDVGETLTYTFVVTNTGVTTVDNVTVTDPLPGISAIEGPHGTSLAPGESATFTATYVVTELDGIAGMVMNTATASGTGSDGGELTSTDSVAIRACQVPEAASTPTAEVEADEVVDEDEESTPTPPVENESETQDPNGEDPVADDTDGEDPAVDEADTEEPAPDDSVTDDSTTEDPVENEEEVVDTPDGDTPPAEEPNVEDEDTDQAQRVTVFGFQQLADCEPLPVDPAPDPQPAPQQPAPGAPSAPPVTSLPSTGQGSAPEGLGVATTLLITAGLGIVLAAGTIVIRRNRA